jgi:hypothetical protein
MSTITVAQKRTRPGQLWHRTILRARKLAVQERACKFYMALLLSRQPGGRDVSKSRSCALLERQIHLTQSPVRVALEPYPDRGRTASPAGNSRAPSLRSATSNSLRFPYVLAIIVMHSCIHLFVFIFMPSCHNTNVSLAWGGSRARIRAGILASGYFRSGVSLVRAKR